MDEAIHPKFYQLDSSPIALLDFKPVFVFAPASIQIKTPIFVELGSKEISFTSFVLSVLGERREVKTNYFSCASFNPIRGEL